ncbi:secretion protein HlyD [Selenomonas massiliensis]|uniref:secretion protein HlyD n=1 Tax=Selenomonas massiliensis TaxID=2058293 RepID=UPI001F2860E1|nr:secretion protein HlyD [Selenomonas massiliensis]
MKSVRLVQIFCPVEETNRTHSKSYVEDLSTMTGRKRYAKVARLNLSVLPIVSSLM